MLFVISNVKSCSKITLIKFGQLMKSPDLQFGFKHHVGCSDYSYLVPIYKRLLKLGSSQIKTIWDWYINIADVVLVSNGIIYGH